MSIDDERRNLVREWLLRAEDDRQAAEFLLAAPRMTGIVAFHCQQALEKALKGFLAWHDQPFRRTHDVAELAELCRTFDGAFDALLPIAERLNPFAVEVRYPPGLPHPTSEEAAELCRLTRAAVALVRGRLPADSAP